MAIKTSYIKATRADKTSTFEGDVSISGDTTLSGTLATSGNITASKHLLVKDTGIETVTVDSSGNGTTTVTFNDAFSSTPAVFLTAQEADTTGVLSATGVSTTHFTLKVAGTSAASSVDVAWLAAGSA